MTHRPARRIGVLGAGQLALMLAQAARGLDVEVLCAGASGDCAGQAATVVPTDLDDADSVARFAAMVDLVTIESENIDARVVQGLNLFPNARALAIAQDRLLEKQFLVTCGTPVAPFAAVDGAADLGAALKALGTPAILKTRRLGYDGKGQVRLYEAIEAEAAWREAGSVPCILERMVSFDAEVSLIAARGASGEIVFYPLVQNHHREGILRTTIAPYAGGHRVALQHLARQCMERLLTSLDYVGVLAVEFFIAGNELIANEMAPRVHNSGHWTIEGAKTSQFENHLRAVLGLPLGSTASQPTVMLNCIGSMPGVTTTESFSTLSRHDYHKDFRPGRKVGHLTFPASADEDIAHWQGIVEQLG